MLYVLYKCYINCYAPVISILGEKTFQFLSLLVRLPCISQIFVLLLLRKRGSATE